MEELYAVLRAHLSPCPCSSLGIKRERFAQAKHFFSNLCQDGRLGPMMQRLRDPVRDLPHFILLHAAGRERRGSDANAAWLQRWIRVKRNRVLIDSNSRLISAARLSASTLALATIWRA